MVVSFARGLRALALSAAMLLPGAVAAQTAAEEGEAVALLFGRPHLADIGQHASLRYTFSRESVIDKLKPFTDTVEERIEAVDDKGYRTLSFTFFTEGRRRPVPELSGYTANPMVMLFLQRDVHELGQIVQANPNFLKNKIRYALRAAVAEPVTIEVAGKQVAAHRIVVTPFADDELRLPLQEFAERTYVFVVSDAVPGELVSITVTTPANAAKAAEAGSEMRPLLLDTLTFTALVPGSQG